MQLILYAFLSLAFNIEATEAGLVLLPYLTARGGIYRDLTMKLSKLPKLQAKAASVLLVRKLRKLSRKLPSLHIPKLLPLIDL